VDRIAPALGAMIGLVASIGPSLMAQIFPGAADVKLFGVCILGTIISMRACVRH
jgi:hypothetical protein